MCLSDYLRVQIFRRRTAAASLKRGEHAQHAADPTEFSAAERGGLIEAALALLLAATDRAFSAAERGGLIEAG